MSILPPPSIPAEPPARAPEFDPLVAFPDLAALRDSVLQMRWEEVTAFFDALADPADRATAIRIAAETPDVGGFLQRTAAAHPGSALPRVLLGNHYIHLAWEARGAARAKYVSAENFTLFHRRLAIADKLLAEVTAEESDNTDAWRLRLITSRGLQRGIDQTRLRYRKLAVHDPHDYIAQSQLLQQLLPKWGGTWEDAFAFARQCRHIAEPGSLNPVVLAEVHLERWLNVGSGKDPAHLRRPDVITELVDAANHSVLHPDFRGGYQSIEAHGHFAAAFGLAEEHALAAPHFRALNGYASEYPWAYLRSLTSPGRGTAYKRLRRRAAKAG
ncbi:hypothetical protein [Kitasatospora griseola]|uniref:hypothetical protein n=1 Tax=Kitasatospora griseola TaxID=2064 RepID=UPI001670153E|nr:hypothetical protein [Kitasatospora griseola]